MTSDIRAEVLAQARRWIGTPYHHRASLRGAGCDCLGLIRGIWRALHGAEPEMPPDYAPDWAEASGAETLRDAARRHLIEVAPRDARPGDALLFRIRRGGPARHCGILGHASGWNGPAHPQEPRSSVSKDDATLIHAWSRRTVAEVPLAPWRPRLSHAFRFPTPEDPQWPRSP